MTFNFYHPVNHFPNIKPKGSKYEHKHQYENTLVQGRWMAHGIGERIAVPILQPLLHFSEADQYDWTLQAFLIFPAYVVSVITQHKF
jgi:hypothetical protein